MRRHLALFSLATFFVSAMPAAHAQRMPAEIHSRDPLSMPPPAVAFHGFVHSAEPPEAKLTQELWRKAVISPGDRELEIVVTLAEPAVAASAALRDPAVEAERVEQIALLAHHLARDAQALGFEPVRALSHFPIVIGRIANRRLLELAGLPQVRTIEETRIYHASRTQGGALMRADQLRTVLGGTGAGVGVAILDSGISFTHPEVASNIKAQGDYTGTTGSGNDDNGHGTSAAGIVAGLTGGMAPQAGLWAIKVLKADGSSTSTSLLDGLNGAFAARNQFGGLDIVNMSLGGLGPGNIPFNASCDAQMPALASMVNQFVAAGIAVFAASGNEGCLAGVASPACLSNVISVGAVYDANIGPAGFSNVSCISGNECDDATTAADQITCYSNSGVPLDILAPSHCASAPSIGTTNVPCFGGTSAASPYAAGVAAQILSLLPATTPGQLQQALMTTGKPITDPGNGIVRHRIDALSAYQSLAAAGVCVRDADTACLQGNRFEVNVVWSNNQGSGPAQVMSFGGQRAENNESAFYYFQSPANFEMGVKVLNACVPFLGNKFWVFISGLTDQGWAVTVRDTQKGAVRTYSNPVGNLSTTFADTNAFDCP